MLIGFLNGWQSSMAKFSDHIDLVLVFSFIAMVMFSHSQPAHILVKKLVSDCKLFIF